MFQTCVAGQARILLVCLLVTTALPPSHAAEVPFGSELVVDPSVEEVRQIRSVDLDRDGDLDLFGGDWNNGSVLWWENQHGDGSTWLPHGVATSTHGILEVEAGDIDGDGDIDLAGAVRGNWETAWWENTDGMGLSWTHHQIHPGESIGAGKALLVDLDRDGDLDWVDGISFYSLDWWENQNGDGTTWELHLIAASATDTHVTPADLNRDGWTDLVGVSMLSSCCLWWENPAGQGESWTAHVAAPDVFQPVISCVFDGDLDGDLDIAFSSYEYSITYCENLNGAGTDWSVSQLAATSDVIDQLQATDLDADGDPDIIASETGQGTVTWYENGPDGWIERPVAVGLDTPRWVEAADLDSDGDPDLGISVDEGAKIVWWPNQTIHGSAYFPEEHAMVGAEPDSLVATDLDRDGDMDLLGAEGSAARVSWWESFLNGAAWDARTVDGSFTDGREVRPVDLDGDGDRDVLGISGSPGTVTWWENLDGQGAQWLEHMVDVFHGALAVHPVDLDRDGDPDILAAAEMSVTWWENDGAGLFWTAHPIPGWAMWPRALVPGDVDGDGDPDFLVTGQVDAHGQVSWYENRLAESLDWSERVVDAESEASWIGWADLNRDGRGDILASIPADRSVVWYDSGEAGEDRWTPRVVTEQTDATELGVADLDRDGDLDLLGSDPDSCALFWWENRLDQGSFWLPHQTSQAPAACPIAAELDGDARVDLVGCLQGIDPGIHRWPNRGGQFRLATVDTAPDQVLQGEAADVLTIYATHLGRTGDSDVELVSLELILEEEPGDPLTSAEANAMLRQLAIFRYILPPAETPWLLVALIEDLVLSPEGRLSIPLEDGHPYAQIEHGVPAELHVYLETEADAAGLDPNRFRVTHLTRGEQPSRAEDAQHDLPVLLEQAPDVTSGIVQIVAGSASPTRTPTPTRTLTPTRTPTISPSTTPDPTSPPSITPEPTVPPSGTPDPTIPPTGKPSPGATLTPTPSATPTQHHPLGVRLDLNPSVHPGETFFLNGYLDNPGGPMLSIPTFFILEIHGQFWFWPSWSWYAPSEQGGIDYERLTVPTGTAKVAVLAPFPWPDTGSSSQTGLLFYGAMTDPMMTRLLGRMASETWEYGP